MRSRSALWESITIQGRFELETKAKIAGKEYTAISAPVINRALMDSPLSVGNCISATLSISVLTEDDIPPSSVIVIMGRVKRGTEVSEWMEFGTFYINQRNADYDGLITFSCYDAMLKASQRYVTTASGSEGWPKSMSSAVAEIAGRIGVELDSRTVINTGEDYVVSLSTEYTMLQVLGYIGACHGGNWVITPENKLRLVPLSSTPTVQSTGLVNIPAVLGQISTGDAVTVTGVSMDGKNDTSYIAGSSTGAVIKLGQNPYATTAICDNLITTLEGLVYSPYSATNTIYDPAAELGDPIKIGSEIFGVLAVENSTFDVGVRADISAPNNEELSSEYPYLPETDQIKQTVANLKSALSTAETNIEQNAEEIELRATKTEVTETLGGYYTKEEADSALSVSAEEIKAEVSGKYTENEEFEKAKSSISQLSDVISALVSVEGADGTRQSLMTQTENGWTFDITKILNSVNELSEMIGYVAITIYDDEPCIELGKKGSDFKVRITNTKIQFLDGDIAPASISNQQLNIGKATVEDVLQFGDFAFKKRDNGNMGLMWVG